MQGSGTDACAVPNGDDILHVCILRAITDFLTRIVEISTPWEISGKRKNSIFHLNKLL